MAVEVPQTLDFWAFCDLSKFIHTTFVYKTWQLDKRAYVPVQNAYTLKEVNDAGISLVWIAWSPVDPVVPNVYGGPSTDATHKPRS